MIFRSKVDGWIGGAIAVSASVGLFVSISIVANANVNDMNVYVVFAFFLLLIGVGFPLWVLFDTKYIVNSDVLIVKSGPFSWRVNIVDITSVTETKNPLSSPALSLDRLNIDYAGRSIIVSPKNKQAFLQAIDKQLDQ